MVLICCEYVVTVGVILSRVQIGLRVDAELWMSYKRLCQDRNFHPNVLVEAAMRNAVGSRNLKGVVDAVSVTSESQSLADRVNVRNMLGEIERAVEQGYVELDLALKDKGVCPERAEKIQRHVDEVLRLLPRVQDSELIDDARISLDRASFYLNVERHYRNPHGSMLERKLRLHKSDSSNKSGL